MSATAGTQLSRLAGVVVSFHGALLTTLAFAAYPLGHSQFASFGRGKKLILATGVVLLVLGQLMWCARRLPTWVEYLRRRWDSYSFHSGGNYCRAIARIAVASSLIFSGVDQEDYRAFAGSHRSDVYWPKGILLLWGDHPPPLEVLEVTSVVSIISILLFF